MTPDKDMRITILGSGVCVPSLSRSSCALLVEACGAVYVCDMGPGTMHRLAAAKIRVSEVDYLLLSHFHPDHSGELASFLFANKYSTDGRREKKLTIVGGKGIRTFMDRLAKVYGSWIDLGPEMIRIEEMPVDRPGRRIFPGVTLSTAPMNHNPESVAFRLDTHRGRSVVYSGDTDMTDRLIDLARNADILVCEASLPDDMKVPGHLTPCLAGEIAARASVKQLVLTHCYPECENTDRVGECRKTYEGPLVLAEDLMVLSGEAA